MQTSIIMQLSCSCLRCTCHDFMNSKFQASCRPQHSCKYFAFLYDIDHHEFTFTVYACSVQLKGIARIPEFRCREVSTPALQYACHAVEIADPPLALKLSCIISNARLPTSYTPRTLHGAGAASFGCACGGSVSGSSQAKPSPSCAVQAGCKPEAPS